MYYGLDGQKISMEEWGAMVTAKEKILKQETLPNGRWISTVWLGLDHSFGDGPPLIFETMVFPSNGDLSEEDMDRYSTREEALVGHQRMVEKWTKVPA